MRQALGIRAGKGQVGRVEHLCKVAQRGFGPVASIDDQRVGPAGTQDTRDLLRIRGRLFAVRAAIQRDIGPSIGQNHGSRRQPSSRRLRCLPEGGHQTGGQGRAAPTW